VPPCDVKCSPVMNNIITEMGSSYQINFNGQLKGYWGGGSFWCRWKTTKMSSPTSPFPSFKGRKRETKREKSNFPFKMMKLCCKVWSAQQRFEIDEYLPFCDDFSAPVAIALCSKRCVPYFRNGCIDLHVWHTVGKLIEDKSISRRGAISSRRARPTAIAVPLF